MTALQMASSVALFASDKVLLVQRARSPYRGYWTLPGGRAEPSESPEECAKREVEEELGMIVQALTPVVVQKLAGYELSVFASRAFSGTPHPNIEIADIRWCRAEEAEGLKTTPGLDEIILKTARVLAG